MFRLCLIFSALVGCTARILGVEPIECVHELRTQALEPEVRAQLTSDVWKIWTDRVAPVLDRAIPTATWNLRELKLNSFRIDIRKVVEAVVRRNRLPRLVPLLLDIVQNEQITERQRVAFILRHFQSCPIHVASRWLKISESEVNREYRAVLGVIYRRLQERAEDVEWADGLLEDLCFTTNPFRTWYLENIVVTPHKLDALCAFVTIAENAGKRARPYND